jgi:hypothetical protein
VINKKNPKKKKGSGPNVITKDEWPQRLEMTKTDALSEQNAALFAV